MNPTARPKIFEMFLGYVCNARCPFCFQKRYLDLKQKFLPKADVLAALSRARREGADMVMLSAGEPTLDPELPAYVAHCRAVGFSAVHVNTNGLRMADEAYFGALVAAGMDGVCLSVHGMETDHDRVLGIPGAFKKVLRTLENCSRQVNKGGFVLDVNTVACRGNLASLPQVAALLAKLGTVCRMQISMPYHLDGFSADEKKAVMPAMPQAAEAAVKAARAARKIRPEMDVRFNHFPPCSVGPEWAGLCQPEEVFPESAYLPGHSEWVRQPNDKTRVPACSACSVRGSCAGVNSDYLEIFGSAGFTPLSVGNGNAAPVPEREAQ